MSDPTEDTDGLDAATVDEETREAASAHDADRPPTDEESARADEIAPDPDVAEHYEEMNRIGAEVKGEGEI